MRDPEVIERKAVLFLSAFAALPWLHALIFIAVLLAPNHFGGFYMVSGLALIFLLPVGLLCLAILWRHMEREVRVNILVFALLGGAVDCTLVAFFFGK